MQKPESITKNDWFLLCNKYPNKLNKIVKKINKGYPIQYLIGYVDFYDCKILVDKRVLIPRFETELLVEIAINKIREKYNDKKINIIDMGTGSGCIAIKLAKEFPKSNVIAIDKSNKSLKLAKENAKINKVNITFKRKKFKSRIKEKYDVIISNPPYIGLKDEIDKNVLKYEPKKALYAIKEGMYFYEQILEQAKQILNKSYLIFLEIGYNQEKKLTKIIKEKLPKSKYTFLKDFNNKTRFCVIENNVNKTV